MQTHAGFFKDILSKVLVPLIIGVATGLWTGISTVDSVSKDTQSNAEDIVEIKKLTSQINTAVVTLQIQNAELATKLNSQMLDRYTATQAELDKRDLQKQIDKNREDIMEILRGLK